MICNRVLFEHYRTSATANRSMWKAVLSYPARAPMRWRSQLPRDQGQSREILLDLPQRDRSLLKAVFLDERDRDEVCREFAVDRDYLRVLLHRAKQEFKTEYIKRMGDRAALGANA